MIIKEIFNNTTIIIFYIVTKNKIYRNKVSINNALIQITQYFIIQRLHQLLKNIRTNIH